jgi:hypothetical protein
MVCGANLWIVCFGYGGEEIEGHAILQVRLKGCGELQYKELLNKKKHEMKKSNECKVFL